MKKIHFLSLIYIFVSLILLSSCQYLFPEIESEDYIKISGQKVVYAGSTARLTYSFYAPTYEGRYVDLKVFSDNKYYGEAYFTESCKETAEFVIEGVRKGKFIVTLYVKEIPSLKTSYEITVVDSSSLFFDENKKTMERGDKLQLSVNNPQDLKLNFSSSNTDVAEVDSSGVVIAKKSGVAGITVSSEDGYITSTCIVTVKTNAKADRFFWGEWISMYDGSVMVIQESDVSIYKYSDKERKNPEIDEVDSSSSTQITLVKKGTFIKDIQNVIKKDSIPYFRNGGTNLSYKLKLVGFEKEAPLVSNSSRASTAGQTTSAVTNLGGLQVTGKSNSFTNYEDTAISSDDGIVVLTAPVSGDTQTVTISTEDGSTIIIPELTIENDGASMGTVPVVNKGDCTLKVTGLIKEKDDGYLYAGSSYKMLLTVTNISEVSNPSSSLKIQSASDSLSVRSSVYSNLNSISLSTMRPGAAKTIEVIVDCNDISNSFIDTGLDITITNAKTAASPVRIWNDFVPVRFFKEKIPVTFAAKNIEHNGSSLHGFMIYPDGNSGYFEVKDGYSKTLWIPSYGYGKKYKLAFCGATVTQIMSESTEMFYTVNINSSIAKEVVTEDSNIIDIMGFAEGNETENNSYLVTDSFEAYAGDGDIDFYEFSLRD